MPLLDEGAGLDGPMGSFVEQRIAEDFYGDRYVIKDYTAFPFVGLPSSPDQIIVTVKKFVNGGYWTIPFKNRRNGQYGFGVFKLCSHQEESGELTLTFERVSQEKLMRWPSGKHKATKEEVEASFKEFIMRLDVSRENLRELITTMFANTFTAEQLVRFEGEEKIDFINDSLLIYLLSGNTAFRV
jgi:hypothetical protein